MELNITITHVLPPAVITLIERMSSTFAEAAADEPAKADAPKADAPKTRKPRAAKAADPAPEPETAVTEDPAPEAAPAPSKGPSFDDLKTMVKDIMDTVGTVAVREVFAKFKVKRLADLQPKSYAAMAKALAEIKELGS